MTAPVLVVAHEATRTGSPRVLLELLRYATPRLEVGVAVRLMAAGPLAGELRAVATASDDSRRPIAVVVNGALAAGELSRWDDDVPSAVYVHEEGEALRVLSTSAVRGLLGATRVLCVSARSAQGLVDLGLDPQRIVVLPPVVPSLTAPPAPELRDVRAGLGVPEGGRLVVGCGEAGWRKGADLFVQVVRTMAREDPSVRAAWVGRRGRWFGRVLDHDTAAMGLEDRVRWVGEVDAATPFLAAADVLVMTSREDPQPLVPLEAAQVDTPTVGFSVGGLVDFADDGLAVVADYPDVEGLARLAAATMADPAASASLVEAGRARLRTHQSIEVVGPRFVDELALLIGRHGRSEPSR